MQMLAKKYRLMCWASLMLVTAPQAQASRWLGALERYEVEDLHIAFIEETHLSSRYYARFAYVEDPSHALHVLLVGGYFGSHDGKVTDIERCRVLFSDLMSDGSGGWTEVHRSMRSSDWKCRNTKPLPTDVVARDSTVLPAEVSQKLAASSVSGLRLIKEVDDKHFIVWTIVAKDADVLDPRYPRMGKLVVFHKKSRAVDIISAP